MAPRRRSRKLSPEQIEQTAAAARSARIRQRALAALDPVLLAKPEGGHRTRPPKGRE